MFLNNFDVVPNSYGTDSNYVLETTFWMDVDVKNKSNLYIQEVVYLGKTAFRSFWSRKVHYKKYLYNSKSHYGDNHLTSNKIYH